MGRPRLFDENVVLDAAIGQFWVSGYTGTSIRDLAAAMGMTSASLYNAFGDKRVLFVRALERYLDQSMRRRIGALDQAADPMAGLKAFFVDLVAVSLADRRGCMLVNSAMEVAPFDSELRERICAGLAEIEGGFRQTVERAQAANRVDGALPAAEAARLLLSAVVSIRVLARATADRDLLEGIARSALATLARPGEKEKLN